MSFSYLDYKFWFLTAGDAVAFKACYSCNIYYEGVSAIFWFILSTATEEQDIFCDEILRAANFGEQSSVLALADVC